MMTQLAPHWQLLSAPWRQRVTEKTFGGVIGMAALITAVSGVVAYRNGGDTQSLLRAFSGAFAGFIQVLWLLQITAFVQYNHPGHARLVPGNLRSMRQTTVALWLVSSIVCGAILGLAFGHAGNWFLASAVCMVFLLTSFMWPALWFAGFFFPWWLDFGFIDFMRQTAIPLYQEWAVLCGAVALLVCARMLTHVVLQNGNARHQKKFEQMQRLRWIAMPNADGRQASLHHWGTWGTRMIRVVLFPLHRYMQHLVQKPKHTRAHVMARAELVFGGDVHWVMQVSIALCLALLLLLGSLAAFLAWGPSWTEQVRPGWLGLAIGMLFIALTPVMGLHSAILRTKREQSLLVLLPGIPGGAELNRQLASRGLRRAAVTWTSAGLVASQLTYAPGAGMLVAAAYWGLLPVSGYLVQDWSRIQVIQPSRAFVIAATTALGPIVCFIAMKQFQAQAGLVAVCSALLTFAILRWRWQRMQTFPAALPAGRF